MSEAKDLLLWWTNVNASVSCSTHNTSFQNVPCVKHKPLTNLFFFLVVIWIPYFTVRETITCRCPMNLWPGTPINSRKFWVCFCRQSQGDRDSGFRSSDPQWWIDLPVGHCKQSLETPRPQTLVTTAQNVFQWTCSNSKDEFEISRGWDPIWFV